ncbi:MAG: radical SAM family heme chaperone HemW [Flavobacteriaceae bacterium TMED42]|nr:MAG: radical SAM family heme chaperone HemW [Flavobacteriaceae bacterium TMED42]|tara:strand:- start:678 stop:1808 length:1131 start_codon:yes stop_codon:yes gene_type:complete
MAGIYFHFPFCRQACNYCNFHFSTQLKHQEKMLRGFEKEIELRAEQWPDALDSIYFGGGSPSLLTPASVEKLINAVTKNFKLGESIEITIEVNPDDVSFEYLEAMSTIGINRLSIGIQSFLDSELKLMNRIHSVDQGMKSIEWTAKLYENFSVDLIYGIPSSDLSSWKKNLNQALFFEAPHLSIYALTVEPKTVLAHQVKNKKIQLLDEDLVKSQYDWMVDRMEGAGYENYEFSNFSKPGFNAVNNSNYWKGKAYIGIGPAAHSYDGKRTRSWNPSNNIKYLNSIQQGILPAQSEILNTHDAFNEYLMTSLRTSWGVSLKIINQTFGKHYSDYLEKQVENHLIDQRVYWDGDALKVTKKAKFLTDGIASDLFLLKN